MEREQYYGPYMLGKRGFRNLGLVLIAVGAIGVAIAGFVSSVLVVAAGLLFSAAGAMTADEAGLFNLNWWQVSALGLFTISAWAYAFFVEFQFTKQNPPPFEITLLLTVAGSILISLTALDLWRGAKTMSSDPITT